MIKVVNDSGSITASALHLYVFLLGKNTYIARNSVCLMVVTWMPTKFVIYVQIWF